MGELGQVQQATENYEVFVREVNEPWWQDVYLLSELVLQLHDAGKVPGPGQCYALIPHPALGGPNPTNGETIDSRFVQLWTRWCGSAFVFSFWVSHQELPLLIVECHEFFS
jgi:hypothetical protein